MSKGVKYYLASASPRRRELLQKIIPEFEIVVPSIKEFTAKTKPEEVVQDLARQKCDAALKILQSGKTDAGGNALQTIIIASDTLVFFKDKALGKPANDAEAFSMISALSGNWHSVYTGVCLQDLSGKTDTFFCRTQVEIPKLAEREIYDYIATGSPFDKAGGYGIQDFGGKDAFNIKGSYDNVMGLPTEMLNEHLKNF